MTIKELIQTEIENLDEADLADLYQLVVSFVQTRRQAGQQGLLTSLAQIEIDGPPDFAANHDLYISGEKDAGSHLR